MCVFSSLHYLFLLSWLTASEGLCFSGFHYWKPSKFSALRLLLRLCFLGGSVTKGNASSLLLVGLTDGQSEPQSIQPSFLFDPITSPLFGSVLVLTVLLVQPKVKDNCLWSSSWDGMCFCSKHLTPPPGKTLDLVQISKHVLNFMWYWLKWRAPGWIGSPTAASTRWHTEKWLRTNGGLQSACLSAMQACGRKGDPQVSCCSPRLI